MDGESQLAEASLDIPAIDWTLSDETPTRPQVLVLDWLVAFPGIEIQWDPKHHPGFGIGRPFWRSAWANEAARLHMIAVMGVLGDDTCAQRVAPRFNRNGGTPRVTLQTMLAIAKRGWVWPFKFYQQHGVWARRFYWQITIHGKRALLRFPPTPGSTGG